MGVGRWVLYRAATTRSPDGILCRASLDIVLKHPSSWRRDPWGFIFGRWVFGRWVLGVGCWALGVGCFLGVGCSRATTTRSPDGILCRAPLHVVLKYPSSWRRDPWGFIFWALGVGCWVLGVGCAAGSPPGPTLKRALGRPLAACFAPPWLVHLPPTSPPPPSSPPTPTSPPPPPKGREREPRAAAYPLNTPRGPNGVLKPPI